MELKAGSMNLSWDTSYPDSAWYLSLHQSNSSSIVWHLFEAWEVRKNSRTVGQKGVWGKARATLFTEN
jgi:hypothetical protein